jgi:hypothetical protein
MWAYRQTFTDLGWAEDLLTTLKLEEKRLHNAIPPKMGHLLDELQMLSDLLDKKVQRVRAVIHQIGLFIVCSELLVPFKNYLAKVFRWFWHKGDTKIRSLPSRDNNGVSLSCMELMKTPGFRPVFSLSLFSSFSSALKVDKIERVILALLLDLEGGSVRALLRLLGTRFTNAIFLLQMWSPGALQGIVFCNTLSCNMGQICPGQIQLFNFLTGYAQTHCRPIMTWFLCFLKLQVC